VRRRSFLLPALVLALGLGLAAAPSESRADEPEALWAGLRVGGVFPQPFTDLGTTLAFGLEGGWVLPYRGGLFALAVQAQYTQPPADGQGEDPRLANPGYEWSITQRELSFGVRGLVRGRLGRWIPYAALGPRLYLLETRANGAAGGEPFGEQHEISTELGGQLAGGLVYPFASAGVFAEAGVAFSRLDHLTTGETSTGEIEAVLGGLLWF